MVGKNISGPDLERVDSAHRRYYGKWLPMGKGGRVVPNPRRFYRALRTAGSGVPVGGRWKVRTPTTA